MMSIEVKPKDQQSSSANYNYYDGDKIREALIGLYLKAVVTNKNIPEQLKTFIPRNAKPWWKMIDNTTKALTSFEEGYGSTSNESKSLVSVINAVRGNVTGAFKFDLAAAVVAIHVVLQFNNSEIPLYIEDINTISDKVLNFYATVYTTGFKGIIRPQSERNKMSPSMTGDSGDMDTPQQIAISEVVNKVPTVKVLKENFKIFLKYLSSLQESLTMLHQMAKTDKKDKQMLPYTKSYTYKEILDANDGVVVLTEDGQDYTLVPKFSMYRIMLVAWIWDIKTYQDYAKNKQYLDFMDSEIFKNSGYFTNFIENQDRIKGFLTLLLPAPEYLTMIEQKNDLQVTQNLFKKAFIETKKYYNQLVLEGNDISLDIDIYENDHMSFFRDFYSLLSNCSVNGENYRIQRIGPNSDTKISTIGTTSFVISVLGSEYDNTQPQGFKSGASRINFNGIIPLVVDIPEAKYDANFWTGMNSIEEWYETDVNRRMKCATGYNIPVYSTVEGNELYRQVPTVIKHADSSSCRAILLDNGKGKHTDAITRSIYMSLHLDILHSFNRIQSSEETLLHKVAIQRLKEIEEYSVFRDLAPRRIDRDKIEEYPLHKKILANLEMKGDYNFNLFHSPVEDIKNITKNLNKISDVALRDTISDILVLSSGEEYNSLIKYSTHTSKSNSVLYTHIKKYAYELLRRYIHFLFTAWEANNWNFAAHYGNEEKMFLILKETFGFQPIKVGPRSVRVLHLLSKPFIINSSIGDLYKTHGIPFVESKGISTESTMTQNSLFNIMEPQKNEVELVLAQIPDNTNGDESFTVLLSPNTWVSTNIGQDEYGYTITFPAISSPQDRLGAHVNALPSILKNSDVIYVDKTIDSTDEKRGVKI